jgi:predicted RNase H-like HicB family nuclease
MVVQWSNDDRAYLVTLPEWEGRIFNPVTHGESYEDAFEQAHEALTALAASARQRNEPLPEPRTILTISIHGLIQKDEEVTRAQDDDALMTAEIEEPTIAGDQIVGSAELSRGQHQVVLRIPSDSDDRLVRYGHQRTERSQQRRREANVLRADALASGDPGGGELASQL